MNVKKKLILRNDLRTLLFWCIVGTIIAGWEYLFPNWHHVRARGCLHGDVIEVKG